MISKIPQHQSKLHSIFIVIIERLSEICVVDDYKNILIKFIPQYCINDIKHEYKDVAINQIKLFGLIAVKAKHIFLNQQSQETSTFIEYIIKKVEGFLKERFSVYVKKEVFNLICLIADFPM